MIAAARRRARWRRPSIELNRDWFRGSPKADHEPDSWSAGTYACQCAGLALDFISVVSVLGLVCAILWSV